MKNNLAWVTFAWCAFSIFAISQRGSADSTSAVVVNLSVANPVLSPNLPIIIGYTITNHSDKSLVVNLDDGRSEWQESSSTWITSEALDEHGLQVSSVPLTPKAYMGAYSNSKRIGVNETLDGTIVLNRGLLASHAGSYSLICHVRLPYTTGNEESDKVFSRDYHLPILITDTNHLSTSATASVLVQRYLTSNDREQKERSLKCLLALPEQEAYPYWRELLLDARIDDASSAAEYLADMPSPEGASLVVDLCSRVTNAAPLLIQLDRLLKYGKIDKTENLIPRGFQSKPTHAPLLRLD